MLKNPMISETGPAIRGRWGCLQPPRIKQRNGCIGITGVDFKKHPVNTRDPIRFHTPDVTGRCYRSASEHSDEITGNPKKPRSPVLHRNPDFTAMPDHPIRPENRPFLLSFFTYSQLRVCRKPGRKGKTNE